MFTKNENNCEHFLTFNYLNSVYILFFNFFIAINLSAGEQSTTEFDSRQLSAIESKNYTCGNLRNIFNSFKNTQGQTTSDCDNEKITENPKEILLSYKNSEAFNVLNEDQHEKIKFCLAEDKRLCELGINAPANCPSSNQVKKITDFYYYNGRIESTSEMNIQKGKFIEQILSSAPENLVGEYENFQLNCSLINNESLLKSCKTKCQPSSDVYLSFIKSYKEAYDDLKKLENKKEEIIKRNSTGGQGLLELPRLIDEEIQELTTRFPLLIGTVFEKQIKNNNTFDKAILSQLKSNQKKINDDLIKLKRASNCLNGTLNCDSNYIFEALEVSTTYNPKEKIPIGFKSAECRFKLLESNFKKSNMYKQAGKDIATDAILVGSAALTGGGNAPGAIMGISNFVVTMGIVYRGLSSWAEDCTKEEINSGPEVLTCNGSAEVNLENQKKIQNLNKTHQCITNALVAMVSSPGKLIKLGKKISKAEQTENNLSGSVLKSSETEVAEVETSKTVKKQTAKDTVSKGEKLTIENEVKIAEREKIKKQWKEQEAIRHDEMYKEPGTIDRNVKSISDLKRNYAQANFTKASESESYHKLVSEHPERFEFLGSRLNLIKSCNDNLSDKDACTALGHLFLDLFSEKINLLKKKYPELIFDSKLKYSEVAIDKNNKSLIEEVKNAILDADTEWKGIIKKNGFIDELILADKKYDTQEKIDELKKMFDINNWYTEGQSSEIRELSEKAAEYESKVLHKRTSNNENELIEVTKSTQPRTNSGFKTWDEVEKEFDKNLDNTYSIRKKFYEDISSRENGRVLEMLTDNVPGVGPVMKSEVWEIVRKLQRNTKKETTKLLGELNQKLRDSNKNYFKVNGESPKLTFEEARTLQNLYKGLEPFSASPKQILRTPPEAGIFKDTGGISFDLKSFGALNTQNAELAIASTKASNIKSGAKEVFKRVNELDKPTTDLLENTSAELYMGAIEFAKKKGIEVKYINKTGDDVLLSFSRELSKKERGEFLSIVSNQVSKPGIFRSSWVPKGVDEELASKIANVGESVEKAFATRLKMSKKYQSVSKGINTLIEREGEQVNLVIKMDSNVKRQYQNLSQKEKRAFESRLQKLLDSAAKTNSSKPGKVRLLSN